MMLKGSFMIPQTSTWLPRKQYTAIRNEAFIQKKRMKEWEQKCIKKEVFLVMVLLLLLQSPQNRVSASGDSCSVQLHSLTNIAAKVFPYPHTTSIHIIYSLAKCI